MRARWRRVIFHRFHLGHALSHDRVGGTDAQGEAQFAGGLGNIAAERQALSLVCMFADQFGPQRGTSPQDHGILWRESHRLVVGGQGIVHPAFGGGFISSLDR